MRQQIINEISSVLGIKEFVLEKPKDRALAHYALPCFAFSKERKTAPNIVASEFASKFADSELLEASVVGGYLNFRLKPQLLQKIANSVATDDKVSDKQSIFIEYISANPTGPLHIGHVRGAVYGDTLARIARHLGHEVKTEYYINDAGNQIELLGISLALWAKEHLYKQIVTPPEKYYRGEYMQKICEDAENRFGKEIFYDENRVLELADFGKDEVLKIIQKDLADAGIFIESWASEVAHYDKLQSTIKTLEKSGQMYQKDGKTFIASASVGDSEDRVVIREDGRPTYLAGDIVYHNAKYAQNYDRYINIWGADHHGYIARIKAATQFLGVDPDKLEVILMQMVSLLKDNKPFKMSKRAGTAILMSDILNEIGSDALRYIFISKSANTSLEFDIDELKKEDSSNPVYYINYAHARINQLFIKAGKSPNSGDGAGVKNLNSDALNLLFEALSLNEVLKDALNSRALHKLPDFLRSLAGSFHKFYNENRVIGSEHEDALLWLFGVVSRTIKVGLSLMGIAAKNKMDA